MCAIRNNTLSAYQSVYTIHAQLREGKPVSERQISAVLTTLTDYITCGVCGQIIARLDNSSFVAKCGHVFHKTPINCWAQAHNTCCLCERPA
jgi:regulator of sigma D